MRLRLRLQKLALLRATHLALGREAHLASLHVNLLLADGSCFFVTLDAVNEGHWLFCLSRRKNASKNTFPKHVPLAVMEVNITPSDPPKSPTDTLRELEQELKHLQEMAYNLFTQTTATLNKVQRILFPPPPSTSRFGEIIYHGC